MMKAWIQLILMCAMIITGGVFAGCSKGGSGSNTRVSPQSQRDNTALNRIINKLKDYDCNLNQTVERVNQDAKIVCSDLDDLNNEKLDEVSELLSQLENELTLMNRNVTKTQEERNRYAIIMDAASTARKDVRNARRGLTNLKLETREERLESLEEVIIKTLDRFADNSEGCFYEEAYRTVSCDYSLENMLEEVRVAPRDSAKIAKQIEMRKQSYKALIKDLRPGGDIQDDVESWHKDDDSREDRAKDIMAETRQILSRAMPRALENEMRLEMYRMDAAMTVIFALDLDGVVKEINEDLESRAENYIDIEIQMPFDLEGIEEMLDQRVSVIVSETIGDSEDFDVIGYDAALRKINTAQANDVDALRDINIRVQSHIDSLEAVQARYESMEKDDANGDAVETRLQARRYLSYISKTVRKLESLKTAAKNKADRLNPPPAS